MRKLLSPIALLLILAIVVLPFTNCSGYQDTPEQDDLAAQGSCDSDCITAVKENLEISPGLGSALEYRVIAGLSGFDIGGDCNEAGFSNNKVIYELRSDGVVRRHSQTMGYNSRCINGRFRVYVHLGAASGDNVNRSGLTQNGPGTPRVPYDLYIEVIGLDKAGTTESKNGAVSRKKVSLIPI